MEQRPSDLFKQLIPLTGYFGTSGALPVAAPIISHSGANFHSQNDGYGGYVLKNSYALVCLLVLGLPVAGYSRSGGPPANRSGVTGAYCTVCHAANPLNVPGGGITVSGLPAAWLPGSVYMIRVTVNRPETSRYGFQMTAVDTATRQAGDFQAGSDGRSSVVVADVNGSPLQHVQHNALGSSPGGSNTFEFSWRAPADAAIGAVRFNLAANAANNDGSNRGDFIYSFEAIVPVGLSGMRTFRISDRGMSQVTTGGGAAALTSGHARVSAETGSTTPSAFALFAYRPSDLLVSEVGIPAVTPSTSGRLFAHVDGTSNTGVAFSNPGTETASVSFYFTDSGGNNFGHGTLSVPANGQVVGYLSDPRFFVPNPFRPGITAARTFTYTSSAPVGVIALRGTTNEQSDYLMSSVPVTSIPASTLSTYVPHFADGGGWLTEVILVNPSDDVLTGSFSVFGTGTPTQSASALTTTLNGQSASSFSYTIQPRSAVRWVSVGTATAAVTGSVRVSPASGSRTPSAFTVFSQRRNSVTSTIATAGSGQAGTAFRVHAETFGDFAGGGRDSLQTGVAMTNTSSSAANVRFELIGNDGSPTAFAGDALIAPNGQAVAFLHQIPGFSSIPGEFRGILRITSNQPLVLTGLRGRYNSRSTGAGFLLTTIPAALESDPTTSSEVLFPHVVDAAGFETQFVLWTGAGGQSSNGTVRFFAPDGRSLTLALR